MFTLTNSDRNADHYACLSTDEKPRDGSVRNGSDAIEMDTSEVFMFDGDAKRWRNLATGELTGPPVIRVQTEPAISGIAVTAQMNQSYARNGAEVKTGITDSKGVAEIEVSTLGEYEVSTEYSQDIIVEVTGSADYETTAKIEKVYGVSWDGTETTKWKRTGDSALFTNPVPYVAGAASYSSPFDNIMPWSGMTVEERSGGTMVKIPKFYYKLVKNGAGGLDISISSEPVHGFFVSPAHMDRGDGKGERDAVYIGRYHCSSEDYKSKTGMPKNRETRDDFRTGIHALGDNIWQTDFAMWLTIRLLYLVEFADWDSQARIGWGCGDGAIGDMGYTDTMPYHTGTMKTSRKTPGLSTQYRNIEGLWDNVADMCDGCFYGSENELSIIINPSKFSDIEGGISVGAISTGKPSEFSISDAPGFPMFYPKKSEGTDSTCFCDSWAAGGENPWLLSGGWFRTFHQETQGLFCIMCGGYLDMSNITFGSRIQELP